MKSRFPVIFGLFTIAPFFPRFHRYVPCCLSHAPGSVTLHPYFLCPGQHNRQRQRKLWVQRHAGRTARRHTLPGCMGCGPKCSGSAGRGHCAILAARSRVGTPILRCRAGQLNESRLELLGFTIPPAWPCHAVPPLHKGGFFFAQANTTGPSSHNPHGCSIALGPYRAPPGARKRSGVRWPDGQAVLPHQIAQQSQTQKSSPEQQESFFFWLGCLTGCGSTACQWRLATGSAVWGQRHAAHQISGLASAGRALG